MLPLSSAVFAFSAVAILLYWLSYRSTTQRLIVLLAANFYFLARFAWFYPVILLLAATADFLVGLRLQDAPRGPTGGPTRRRKWLVSISLLVNIGLLATTKFLPIALGGMYQWVFPLSLSFYCFQSLTYTIDIYRGTGDGTRSYLEHLTAASLFTVIVAGPINRISNLIRQMQQPFSLTGRDGGRAFLLIASGLMKKLLIADFLSENVVNRVFDTPRLYSGAEVLFGIYGYALQIYFDFSGYTDIAMGLSQLLGLSLPDNFNRPYSSASLREFWNRWHITFSHWLRDYVYFSLPRAARWKGAPFCYPLLVMLLGGLWHGIGWPFVVWGLLHGVGLVGLNLYQTVRGRIKPPEWRRRISVVFTFHYVCLTWVFFRAPDFRTATEVLARLGSMTFTINNISWTMLAVMLAGVAVHASPTRWFKSAVEVFGDQHFVVQGAALAAVVLLVEALSGRGATSFVYSNF